MSTKIFTTLLILCGVTLTYGAQSEWLKFSPPEGRFSVMLPHEPKFELITDPDSKEVANYRYTALETGYGFICEYFDVTSTGADTNVSLDQTRDGILRGADATLVSEEKISLNGYPGRELELAFKQPGLANIAARTRIYLVGKRVYSLTYMHAKGLDSKTDVDNGAKFFSSFTLTMK